MENFNKYWADHSELTVSLLLHLLQNFDTNQISEFVQENKVI